MQIVAYLYIVVFEGCAFPLFCTGVDWFSSADTSLLECFTVSVGQYFPAFQRHYDPSSALEHTCPAAQHHIPDDLNVQQHCCANPKSCVILVCLL
jgi:hypothetical protein